jgi:hypothetical protein
VQGAGSAEVSGAVANVLEELKSVDFGLGSDSAVDQLLEGRIHVVSTIDERIQRIANRALETVSFPLRLLSASIIGSAQHPVGDRPSHPI